MVGGDIFELSSGLDAWTNGVEPVGRNGLDTLFAGGWQRIVRQMEASQQKTSAAAEAGGMRPAGGRNIDVSQIA
ncbi:MAG TPA: hypothetical protein VGS58_00545 [Candidatus Sulfopaludibacter sp.]|nr:hypothetical protein [Candidatus Sulfopaludibacter sp.]